MSVEIKYGQIEFCDWCEKDFSPDEEHIYLRLHRNSSGDLVSMAFHPACLKYKMEEDKILDGLI